MSDDMPSGRSGRAISPVRLARIAKFVKARINGATQIDAWRSCTKNWRKMTEASQAASACMFEKHPLTQLKLREAQKHITVSAIDSHGQFHTDLMADIAAARAEQNWTAVAALQRIRASSGTFGGEKIVIGQDAFQAKAAIDAVAKLDPATAASMRRLLGSEGFSEPANDSSEAAPDDAPAVSQRSTAAKTG